MELCLLKCMRNTELLHLCLPSTSTQKGLWKVCLAGCSGCSSSQAEKRIRPRINNLWSDVFCVLWSNSPENSLPCPASRCPMRSDAALFYSSLLTPQKTHYKGSGHPWTSVSLHPLPSRVAVHTKHALKAHDVFQSWLSPKPSAKNKLVKSCFSQKDEILSCLPLQDNRS